MVNFVELMIPIDRDWMHMLDTVALPVIQTLSPETPYFFTNDSQKILRLRLEETSFEAHKNEIYTLLLAQLQSDNKVKVYKQNYLLEEARFGKVSNHNLHTDLFYRCSEILISLLQEAEQVDNYENRLPYAVIAIQHLLNPFSQTEQAELSKLYIEHWMYFNEQNNYKELIRSFDEAYSEEIVSLRELLNSLEQQTDLNQLFSKWSKACEKFTIAMDTLEQTAAASHRQKAYYYKSNTLEHPRKWEVIADQIHLLMNRFGILNEDETLVMFLTYSAMQQD